MITCDHAQAQFNDLLDNNLTQRQQARLTAHLDNCPTCKNEYDTLAAVVLLVRQAPVADGKISRDPILSKFRLAVAAKDFAPVKPKFRMPFVPLGMAAAAVASLTMLFILPTLNSPNIPFPPSEGGSERAALPTSIEMDRMMGRHATQSAQVLAPNAEIHSEVATEAFSHLVTFPEED